MLLSIVIPVYKTEPYLEDCLKSLHELNNLKKQVEIIVVSDASPGDAESIVKKYASTLNIKYAEHAHNQSIFQARKTGIKEAKGSYILCLDSDDTLFAMRWNKLLKYLEEQDVDILRYSVAREKKDLFNVTNKIFKDKDIWQHFVKEKLWQLAGTIIKREAFADLITKIDNFRGEKYINMADDLCYSAGLFNQIQKYEIRNGFGYYCYRLNPSSLTRSDFAGTIEKANRLISDYENCKLLALSFLDSDKRKKEFQYLLDSNVKWLIPKISKILDSYPNFWDGLSRVFSEPILYEGILNFDTATATSVLSRILINHEKKEQPKKIGVVVTKLQGGGTERMACSVASMLSKKYDVTLITGFRSENDYEILSSVKVVCIKEDIKRRREILNYCLNNEINTLIFVDYYLEKTLKDILYFKYYEFNVIVQEHNSFAVPLYTGQISLMATRTDVYKLCDLLTCLNNTDLLFWRGAGVNNTIYMPNVLTIKPENNIKKLQPGINKILYLGRLNPLKGLIDIIEIIKYVCSAKDDITFEICGTFSCEKDETYFKNELNKFLKQGKVVFSGPVNNIKEKLKEATFLLLPSHVEGSPMVIGEARSMGTPILMYNLPYIDIAKNGVVLTPPAKPLLLAQTLLEKLNNPVEYERLSRDCYCNLQNWSFEYVQKLWDEAINNLHNHRNEVVSEEVQNMSQQILLAVDYIYKMNIRPNEDKDLLKKINRYDKLMRIFTRFFPIGSTRRKTVRKVASRLSRLM